MVSIAGEVSPTLDKAFRELGKNLDAGKVKMVAVGAAATGAAIAIGDAVGKSIDYLKDLGTQYDTAVGSLSAKTGIVGEELEGLSGTMEAIYGNAFGDSMADVASGLADVQRSTKLAGEELEHTTQAAFALRDVFGYDIGESARAAKAMMENFNVSGQEAMNLIASGAQKGLDYSGELLDSISEYSVQFAKVGMDAEDMFAIFEAGSENGAWNLDKVGDAVKEFSIRSIDGSKTSIAAFEAIGFNAEEMTRTFAQGGQGAKQAFAQVLSKLMDMEDQVARDAAGVGLFGTQWEDLGVEAMEALAKVQGGAYEAGDALGIIYDNKYNNLDSAFTTISRGVETMLLPAAKQITGAMLEATPKILDLLERGEPLISALAGALVPLVGFAVDGMGWAVDNGDALIAVTAGLTAAFATYKAITLGVAAAQKLKNGMDLMQLAMSAKLAISNAILGTSTLAATWPILAVAAAIGVAAAAGVLLWKNWDTVKAKAAAFGQGVRAVFDAIGERVSAVVDHIGEVLHAGLIIWAGIIGQPFNSIFSIINGVISGINSIGFQIPDWVPGIGGQEFSINIPQLPLLPLLAAGGFTKGVSIAGEAGTEAVISFDPRYRQQNLSTWAKAGQMLGAAQDVTGLLSYTGSSESYRLEGVSFAPQIIVQGQADEALLRRLLREQRDEFFDMFEDFLEERRARKYAPGY